MKHLFEKNELGFALLGIVFYMVLNVLGTMLARIAKAGELLRAALLLGAALFLIFLLVRWGLAERYGLCEPKNTIRPFWFVPFALLPVSNFLYGISMPDTASKILYTILLAGSVAILEELLFRGFLFHSLKPKNAEVATILSSLIFGLLHLIPLLDGSPLIFVLCQSALSIIVGYLFATLLLKSGSLLPCIVLHASFNLCGAFAADGSVARMCILTAVQILLSFLCIVYTKRASY